MRVSIVLPVCACFLIASPPGALAGPAPDGNRPARHARVLRVQPNDPLTRHNLAHLEARSRTARDVLDRLALLEHVVLLVRAHPRLVPETRLYGRGRFWVVDGRLFGLLEYQAEPRGSTRALRVLAHELGHALEVALAPRGRDTRALRDVLLAREDANAETNAALAVETKFARLVGYRVHLELTGRAPAGDGLAAAATAARLELPLALGALDTAVGEDRR